MSNPEAFELQVIYTQIVRDKNNFVSFKEVVFHKLCKCKKLKSYSKNF